MKKIYDAEMQYLLVEEARDVGLNGQNMVVDIDDDGPSAHAYGLTPLLVYSIVAPAYRVIVRKLVSADAPISISAFLAEAWSKPRGLGMPMRLEMKKSLLKADKGFCQWVGSLGITCATVQHHGSLAAYSSNIAKVQFQTLALYRDDDAYKPNPLTDANAQLAACDLKGQDLSYASASAALTYAECVTFQAWMSRGQKFLEKTPTLAMDWAFKPLQRREKLAPHMTHEMSLCWLKAPIAGLAEVAEMWPTDFCGELGLTQKQWQDWLRGTHPIEMWQYEALREKLHLAGEDLLIDPNAALSLVGGFIVVAHSADSALTLYSELAQGDDWLYSFEAISTTTDFGGFRVLLFGSDINILTIMLFIRGSAAEALLTRSHLHYFQGPIDVPKELASRLSDAIKHRQTAHEAGHVGCAIEDDFEEWFELHAVAPDDDLDSDETSDHEEDRALVDAMRERAGTHWAQKTGQLTEIRKALALRSPEQALLQIVKDAYIEGIETAIMGFQNGPREH